MKLVSVCFLFVSIQFGDCISALGRTNSVDGGNLPVCKPAMTKLLSFQKMHYDLKNMEQSKKLYYSEQYSCKANTGAVRFRISENRCTYYISSTFEEQVDGDTVPQEYNKTVSTPVVVNGQVMAEAIFDRSAIHRGKQGNNLERRIINSEFQCESEDRDVLCKADVYLNEYRIPYKAVFGLNTYQCQREGVYVIKNYPDVVFEKERM